MKRVCVFLYMLPLLSIMAACEEESLGDNFNFDQKVAAYVAFNSTAAVNVKEGEDVTFSFEVRTAMQQDITITYVVSGDFDIDEQSVVLPRNSMSVSTTLSIPEGTIVEPATTATATVSLLKAVTSDGRELSIGRLNDPETQKKVLNITLP
ncbi:hypothetical protein SAMN05421747_11240 [Parapedobacter composti]|uniref:Calx-beta domain-containing protein n=1 Tax=Parapedobacter composti TaxID=623281 RepID=A0A1I1JHX1_9SPHI|nr:hypothetical protein [Parapedobacter composti]SFC47955.1 hypothetical protein SAMN05421747_11240 [Parapedobacter composti]